MMLKSEISSNWENNAKYTSLKATLDTDGFSATRNSIK